MPGTELLTTNPTLGWYESMVCALVVMCSPMHVWDMYNTSSGDWACHLAANIGINILVFYQSCHSTASLTPGCQCLNSLRPIQNGCHFADDIFKCIFVNENVWIPIKISLKFVPNGPINNIPALVQIKVWRRPGVKPLSEPMTVRLLTHIHVCVTRPQWVKLECRMPLD